METVYYVRDPILDPTWRRYRIAASSDRRLIWLRDDDYWTFLQGRHHVIVHPWLVTEVEERPLVKLLDARRTAIWVRNRATAKTGAKLAVAPHSPLGVRYQQRISSYRSVVTASEATRNLLSAVLRQQGYLHTIQLGNGIGWHLKLNHDN